MKAGDYLIAIAIRNGVTFKALLTANYLIASSTILPGAQLALPPATQPIPALPPALAAATATAAPLTTSFSTGKTYISDVGIAISSTQSSGSSVPVRLGALSSDDKIQTVRRILTP